jgi:4-amino-4-deoxy-L-arabinose transferase-like glycosyltransferase
MQLILGFNGLGRITGQEGGLGGGPPGGSHPGGGGPEGGIEGGFGGTPGLGRMFNTMFGGFIAWWLPAALIGLAAGIWLVLRVRRGQRRTDPRLASLIVWGGWTIVTVAVFSFASGIIHTYYTVALAPGVAALSGMTLPALWRRRSEIVARGFLAVATAATAAMAFLLLRRAPDWQPWLAWAVLVVGLAAAVLLIVIRPTRPGSGARDRGGLIRGLSLIAGVGAVMAGVAGPLAWSLVTIGTTHVGSIPTAGPAVASGQGDPHGLMPGSRRSGRDGFPEGGLPGPGGFPGGGMPGGGMPGGGMPGGGESRG